MPMSVVYATVNGRLVQENRGGVVTRYVADTLGSVIQTRDVAGNQTSSTTYWPFGEVRTSSGTNPSPWGFCGIWGYFKDALTRLYVRARNLRVDISRWMTTDPLWPYQPAYRYANKPTTQVDPSGRQLPIAPWDLFIDPIQPPTLGDLENLCSLGCNDTVRPCLKVSGAFGFSKGHDMTNALGHCMTACCIKKRYPGCVWYWNARELGRLFDHAASCMDDWNNNVGYGCANGGSSCYACCLANIDNLTWYEPKGHNWPPPKGGCGKGQPRPSPEPCNGKICPVGSHLNPVTCECIWH